MAENPERLNLGCGFDSREGWHNVDRIPGPGVDQVWDLDDHPWPWRSGTVKRVLMDNVLEHLHDPVGAIGELRRVLEYQGTVEIVVPHAWGTGAPRPNHRSYWTTHSFNEFTVSDHGGQVGLIGQPWFEVTECQVFHRYPWHGFTLPREVLLLRPHKIRFVLVAAHE